jgi:hypothetical protein
MRKSSFLYDVAVVKKDGPARFNLARLEQTSKTRSQRFQVLLTHRKHEPWARRSTACWSSQALQGHVMQI